MRRAAEVIAGRFGFLDHTIVYPERIRWNESRAGRLWRFHLHYFSYAVDLGIAYAAESDPRYWQCYRALVEDWIAANPPAQGDGWHPFPVSERIVNWIRACQYFGGPLAAEHEFGGRLLTSLRGQARYLAAALERDVTGNHLIKNARALVFAGAWFGGREGTRWASLGRSILVDEAHTQILADGGHYERSPFYHAEVLADYLDVAPLVAGSAVAGDAATGETVERTIGLMRGFLEELAQPDGTLPLFNDAEERPAVPLAVMLGRTPAEPGAAGGSVDATARALPASGYYVFRSGGQRLVLDCGAVCPEHLPAHAHCDLLSFELSCGGVRMITNSGTYTYEPGVWRDAFRGTAAHNTVQAGDEQQSAIWGAFRVGRRARVREAVLRPVAGGAYFRGTYAGFEGNRTLHTREVTVLPGPCWVVVDTVERPSAAPVPIRSRLHFAPRTTLLPDAERFVAAREGAALAVLPFAADVVTLEDAWYSARLGRREKTRRLVMSGACSGVRRLGFIVAPAALPVAVERFDGGDAGWHLRIAVGPHCHDLTAIP